MIPSRNVVCICICALLALVMSMGCGGSQPTITLKAIDCPVENINLSVTVTKRRDPSRTTTTAKIAVTCLEEPVPQAEIHVNFWGLHMTTVTTDDQGTISVNQVTQADTSGLEVTVTVEGVDGEREVVITPVPEL